MIADLVPPEGSDSAEAPRQGLIAPERAQGSREAAERQIARGGQATIRAVLVVLPSDLQQPACWTFDQRINSLVLHLDRKYSPKRRSPL